jgi:hypothetical protein
MPLIHKEPVKLRSDPPEAALPGQEYFVIRFTGEKFIEYEYVFRATLSLKVSFM